MHLHLYLHGTQHTARTYLQHMPYVIHLAHDHPRVEEGREGGATGCVVVVAVHIFLGTVATCGRREKGKEVRMLVTHTIRMHITLANTVTCMCTCTCTV